ncbi:hypothetical protein AB6O49_29005 [Streptomyces sp. SBR177]
MRRALAVATVLLAAVATAVVPGRTGSAAPRPAAEVVPQGVPFLPSPYPLDVRIDSLVAVSLTVEQGVTIRLSDGTQVVTNKYTFTKLKIARHMSVTQRAAATPSPSTCRTRVPSAATTARARPRPPPCGAPSTTSACCSSPATSRACSTSSASSSR